MDIQGCILAHIYQLKNQIRDRDVSLYYHHSLQSVHIVFFAEIKLVISEYLKGIYLNVGSSASVTSWCIGNIRYLVL